MGGGDMSYPSWTDDPIRDAEAFQNYRDEPSEDDIYCDQCGENISKNEDHYFEICGDYYCPDCMDKHRVWIC